MHVSRRSLSILSRRRLSTAPENTNSDSPSYPSIPPSTNSDSSLLHRLFPPLAFPPDLASRLLTHASHPAAALGHNARFAFIGRRVLDAYFHLFLSSSSHLNPAKHDPAALAARTLHTQTLGEHVFPAWNLVHVFRWTPPISSARLVALSAPSDTQKKPPALLRSVGLYKVHGEAVQAIIGGVFYQFVRLPLHISPAVTILSRSRVHPPPTVSSTLGSSLACSSQTDQTASQTFFTMTLTVRASV